MISMAMNNKDIASRTVTRPKVHRLPAPVVHTKPMLSLVSSRPQVKKHSFAALTVGLMALVGIGGALAMVGHKNALVGSITIGTPVTTAVLASSPDTIMLQGDDADKIVGQLVKIPAENEHITEIKSVSEIDNNAGRELLSIISKY
jgi:hypothetical protein